MVSVDAGFLSLFLHPSARPPNDPATGVPLIAAQLRVEHLIEELTNAKERIILPTPALAEFLVLAEDEASEYVSELRTYGSIYIQPFDERAAIELAAIETLARKAGSKRGSAALTSPCQKIKVDRQILAISKIRNAHTIYTDDGDVIKLAPDFGLKAMSSWQLPLPPTNMPLLETNLGSIDLG